MDGFSVGYVTGILALMIIQVADAEWYVSLFIGLISLAIGNAIADKLEEYPR